MKLNTRAIRLEMAKKEMNQNMLAKEAGIDKATLSLLMTKKRRGSIQTWEKIAQALEIEVFELVEKEK